MLHHDLAHKAKVVSPSWKYLNIQYHEGPHWMVGLQWIVGGEFAVSNFLGGTPPFAEAPPHVSNEGGGA